MAFNPNDHLISLKGKDYLQVMHRLVWFRDQFPEGQIDTEVVSLDFERAVFHATVTAIKDGSVVGRASGTGSETPKDFGDYIEKAETKAVGRALAMLGFGTQFAPELDEGERIVDSPVRRPTPINGAVPHEEKPITDQQKRQIFALSGEVAEQKGWAKDWVKDDLYAFFQVGSTTNLTTAQAAKAIAALYQVKDKGAVFADALQSMKGA